MSRYLDKTGLVSVLSKIKNWTEHKGYYEKPNMGIPKNDLTSDIQESLGKADTALQEHQDLSGYVSTSDLESLTNMEIEALINNIN